ncbi:hypothetical protein AUR64_12555 [Haloprofundus marisrubri]|uniref:Small CPxCG-related zinc finger protein n=1 Tax=Haloprofundus marisrubri TaxID=1514971 RepID=A0A0W1RAB6_9EURY|nr:hypothetical protein [Haloprofundus marisrubri]KTG10392.1 hypothetical protein AUR64_12555 [Haloprofundus marisrubri]
MVDPTSSLGDDVDEENAPECATCGEKIVQSPTHRVVTWVEDGTVQHRHFCSDDCRESYDAS